VSSTARERERADREKDRRDTNVVEVDRVERNKSWSSELKLRLDLVHLRGKSTTTKRGQVSK